MLREIYTFNDDGTGSFSYSILGNIVTGVQTRRGVVVPIGPFEMNYGDAGLRRGTEVQFGMNLQGAVTIEETRNIAWEWVPTAPDQEPESFTWEHTDDLLKVSFTAVEHEVSFNIENSENGFILVFQQDIILYKDQ